VACALRCCRRGRVRLAFSQSYFGQARCLAAGVPAAGLRSPSARGRPMQQPDDLPSLQHWFFRAVFPLSRLPGSLHNTPENLDQPHDVVSLYLASYRTRERGIAVYVGATLMNSRTSRDCRARFLHVYMEAVLVPRGSIKPPAGAILEHHITAVDLAIAWRPDRVVSSRPRGKARQLRFIGSEIPVLMLPARDPDTAVVGSRAADMADPHGEVPAIRAMEPIGR
jgi:hypothetical protein